MMPRHAAHGSAVVALSAHTIPLPFPHPTRQAALHLAVYASARYGHKDEGVRRLLLHGADVDHQSVGGHTALSIAARWGAKGLVDLLLRHDAQPGLANELGATPAKVAHACGHHQLARMLSTLMKK